MYIIIIIIVVELLLFTMTKIIQNVITTSATAAAAAIMIYCCSFHTLPGWQSFKSVAGWKSVFELEMLNPATTSTKRHPEPIPAQTLCSYENDSLKYSFALKRGRSNLR